MNIQAPSIIDLSKIDIDNPKLDLSVICDFLLQMHLCENIECKKCMFNTLENFKNFKEQQKADSFANCEIHHRINLGNNKLENLKLREG